MADTKRAKELTLKIDGAILELGTLIEEAKNREEADNIFKEISKVMIVGDSLANDIWDYGVDWEKVKWKDKEKLRKVV